jgi:hypothetical protein
MTDLKLRETTPEGLGNLNSFRRYDILRSEGGTNRKIGEVKWTYRPKNAGGSAWGALLTETASGNPCGMVTSVYSKTIPQLCEIIRHVVTGEGESPRHWR